MFVLLGFAIWPLFFWVFPQWLIKDKYSYGGEGEHNSCHNKVTQQTAIYFCEHELLRQALSMQDNWIDYFSINSSEFVTLTYPVLVISSVAIHVGCWNSWKQRSIISLCDFRQTELHPFSDHKDCKCWGKLVAVNNEIFFINHLCFSARKYFCYSLTQ